MKKTLFFLLNIILLVGVLTSCNDDKQLQQAQRERYMQHQDSVFNYLETNWKIEFPKTTPELTNLLKEWNAWQEFQKEAVLKPTTSIDAYQKKISQLENKVQSITFIKYPKALDERDVKARMTVFFNSVKNLNMFLNLDPIDIAKVDAQMKQVNKDLAILTKQMEKNLEVAKVPLEIGEEEMLELLNDERRANPEEQSGN
ncbi:hypothetical protein [Myroides pelagicus]|uniref:Lipoprotein n=1 Tax=Myroides pelagicus TaxID=270914 RepID=A0A7K1GJ30_9FLAO|nr:hypothetical protein [Myroides pelagicus]MEC4113695.1 hypothetical protein [Myroides pelagicus]MTH28891.1 hypothetical protein [Myroides pelagicus]